MPEKGKLPEWERWDNRMIIFSSLLEKSLSFTELLNETRFARSTLNNHLKDLQEDGIIEKAIEKGRVVYRSTLDENKIESELKKAQFNWVLNFLNKIYPSIGAFIDTTFKIMVKETIWLKRKKLEGSPPSRDEQIAKLLEISQSEFNKEFLEILEKDPEGLKLLLKFSPMHLLEEDNV